jgi:hypothetical protein
MVLLLAASAVFGRTTVQDYGDARMSLSMDLLHKGGR